MGYNLNTLYIDLINGTYHVLMIIAHFLVALKLFSMIKSVQAPSKKRMIILSTPLFSLMIFCIVYIYGELYFLRYFYEDIDFYLYEFLAMTDQIIFLLLYLFYLMKGEKDGKN